MEEADWLDKIEVVKGRFLWFPKTGHKSVVSNEVLVEVEQVVKSEEQFCV